MGRHVVEVFRGLSINYMLKEVSQSKRIKYASESLSTFIANTHMRLLYGICIVLNSVPLSLDLTVNGPRP